MIGTKEKQMGPSLLMAFFFLLATAVSHSFSTFYLSSMILGVSESKTGLNSQDSKVQPTFEEKLQYNMDRFSKILRDERDDQKEQGLLHWLKDSYGTNETAQLQFEHFLQLSPKEQFALLTEFLEWFRREFPYYYDQCNHCQASGCTFEGNSNPTVEEKQSSLLIDKVETYKCQKCHQVTRFPRYLSAMEVVQRKRGRCSEYSLLLYRMLRVLGHRSRWIVDWANHLWAEIWMDNRWVHLDPCEAAVDEQLLYQGWGKKQTFIVAFEITDTKNGNFRMVDVTQKYTSDSAEDIVARRKAHNSMLNYIDIFLDRASTQNERRDHL